MYVSELGKEPSKMELQRVKKNEPVGFYECIRTALIVGKIMWLFPLSGLTQPVGRLTGFSWRTPYFFFYISSLVVQIIKVVLHSHNIFKNAVDMSQFSQILLICMTFVIILIYLRFSLNWKRMLAEVESIETFLTPGRRSSVRKINLIIALMMSAQLLHSSLYVISTAIMTHMCFILPGDSGLYVKSFAFVTNGWIYKIINFDYVSAVVFLMTKFQNTFMWNFTDTLIITISLYLVSRFEDFNMNFDLKLEELKISTPTTENNNLPWDKSREQYTRLMRLVVTIDKYINSMIFLSYSNIMFIGKQIYTVLSKQMKQVMLNKKCSDTSLDSLSLLYYIFTVVFLLARTILLSNFAARIHTLSKKPLNALYTVPVWAYDNAFQRFMDQVYHSNVSLSGLRCFYITREMILTMLASLLTYELMLLQSKH